MTTKREQPIGWATITMGVTRRARPLFEEEHA